MSTLTVARKNGRVAIAADSLTTFEDTRLPPANDADPSKIVRIEAPAGPAYVGVVGFTAHHLVLQEAFARQAEDDEAPGLPDFTSRRGVFETVLDLHPLLKDEFFLLTEGQEGDPYESSQASVLVASAAGLFGVYDLREVHEYRRFWAMGSGFGYALGAMWAAWESAETAAELARLGVLAGCEFDRSSAPPVEVLELELAGE